jgi:hypothetical protein
MAQHWRMFSNPPVVNQYVRILYYVGREGDQLQDANRIVSELVAPAHREDRVRLLKSYVDASRDKAMMISLDRFFGRRRGGLSGPDVRTSDLPDDVAPVMRYFERRFARRQLIEGERVLRTELWYGTAPIARRGERTEAAWRRARLSILREYYDGLIEYRGRAIRPPYQALLPEGDINWVLEYFEE